MTLILHLSDTHFGTEVPAVIAALRRYIPLLQPDVAVISGDLTQRARRGQFERAQAFLGGLAVPVTLTVPGNHDIPLYDVLTRLIQPYRLYQAFFGPRERFWHRPGLAILCLDTTDPKRHTRGEVRLSQAESLLQRARREMGAAARLLVVLHQPFAVAMPQDTDEILINARQAAALFSAYRVDVVLSGHVHMPLITTTTDYFNALPRPFILSGAGTAVSHRVRPKAPNSFNTIRLKENRIEIDLHRYEEKDECFLLQEKFVFETAETGWRPAPPLVS